MGEVAFPVHTVETFLKYDVPELKQKRLIANIAIKIALEEMEKDNPDAVRPLSYYREERRLINLAIQKQLYGDSGPPPQVVNLKTISISNKTSEKEKQRLGVVSIQDFLKMFELD